MRAPFWLKLAGREIRASTHRLGVYVGAITLGVAALVAINSFRAQVMESIDSEARALLGADLRIDSNRAFPDSITAILDSAETAGVPVSRVTTTLSVALTGAGAVRLSQVRAVAGGYPFYGEMVTEPTGMWPRLGNARAALVEPDLLTQLNAAVGDSIRLGAIWFEIAGALTSLPPELSFRGAIGPRIYIHERYLEETGLLQFGSVARREAYLRIPDDEELQQFIDRNHDVFTRAGVGFDTAADQAENLAQALDYLGRFLGLVGLSALLLGGLGVASAVHVFVLEKRRTIAVLRCLGATQRTAFGAYLLQAMLIGTAGAALGAVLGVAVQALLPLLIGGALPIDVQFNVQWNVVVIGVAIGAFVSATFSLLPLLAVRGISPLRALRHDTDDARRKLDAWRIVACVLIVAGIVASSIWQARAWQAGLAYGGALIVGMAILWLCALLLIALTRRASRGGSALAQSGHAGSAARRAFTTRQGIANLYRPRNQTAVVTMSLGFGVFLIATLWLVQHNLLSWLEADVEGPQPNLVVFDIQRDQIDTLRTLFDRFADAPADVVPIVPARLRAINGQSIDQLLDEQPRRVEPWALRREYRHTYRDTLTRTETIVDGEWFDDTSATVAPNAPGIARVSIEQDVARNLDVGVGDTITWDVAGIDVESVITSVRTVDWAQFETNFFFVFESGSLDAAPQTSVSLVAVENDSTRAALQREVVRRFPNVSVIDLATVQRTLGRIVDRVTYAIRFMAAFSLGAGVLVLFGAISASRFQRVRESALLRALGATRAQVRTIMLVEYAALGALAATTGVALAAIASWLLMRLVFQVAFALPGALLLGMWAVVTVTAAVLGMMNSREALRSTPLDALREAEG